MIYVSFTVVSKGKQNNLKVFYRTFWMQTLSAIGTCRIACKCIISLAQFLSIWDGTSWNGKVMRFLSPMFYSQGGRVSEPNPA